MSSIVRRFSADFLVAPATEEARRFLESIEQDRFAEQIANKGRKFLVATKAQEFAGFISLRDNSHINQYFVLTEFHGQGIGKKLWCCMKAAAEVGAYPHTFTVRSSLTAVPVYERFGFIKTADRTEQRGLIFVPMSLTIGSASSR